MNIQIIAYNDIGHRFGGLSQAVNTFDKAMVFDDFDVNIIDLTDQNLWRNKSDNYNQISCNNDLKTLGKLIRDTSNSKIVLLLPGNIPFHYCYLPNSSKYRKTIALKDMLEELRLHVLKDLYFINTAFAFGATTTSLGEIQAKSEFYFYNATSYNIVTYNGNGVVTTIKNTNNSVYCTFVQLNNMEMLLAFLKAVGIGSNAHETAPDWFDEIKMFDDYDQIAQISESQRIILEQTKIVNKAEKVLEGNNRWKSALYTQGMELVEVVYDVFHELLGVDLSGFEDKKREDFCFTYDNCTVIGEIKGVKSGVKNSYISQLDNNLYKYQESHPEDKNKKIALLIINPQRDLAPGQREHVQDDQISLARRNDSLIITTPVLLRLMEKMKAGELSRDTCWKLMSENTGLLIIE